MAFREFLSISDGLENYKTNKFIALIFLLILIFCVCCFIWNIKTVRRRNKSAIKYHDTQMQMHLISFCPSSPCTILFILCIYIYARYMLKNAFWYGLNNTHLILFFLFRLSVLKPFSRLSVLLFFFFLGRRKFTAFIKKEEKEGKTSWRKTIKMKINYM